MKEQLQLERQRAAELLQKEAQSRERVEQESAATKAAVAEAIRDIEALDQERTQLRTQLQVQGHQTCHQVCDYVAHGRPLNGLQGACRHNVGHEPRYSCHC